MSLYSDLNEVLTPYAQKIKSLNKEASDIKADLDTFSEDLAEYRYGGGGLTDEARYNILACFENAAWIDDDGQDYLDALESTLFPVAKLTSITAVYTQSDIVYPDASLESLKDNLVVTAHYDNSSTQILHKNFYSLSGTLTGGTSVIMVSYANKSTTFSVTVTPIAYAFENGTFTFTTYPHSFTVSNGNRVSVDMKAGVDKALYGNTSELSNNTTVGNSADNFLNNGETYFVLHSGETLSTKVTINSVYNDREESGAEISLAFKPRTGDNIRMLGGNVKVSTLYAGQVFELSYTAESDIDVLCCIVYIGTRRATNKELLLDYTIEAKIDGVRVI